MYIHRWSMGMTFHSMSIIAVIYIYKNYSIEYVNQYLYCTIANLLVFYFGIMILPKKCLFIYGIEIKTHYSKIF